MTLKTWIAAVLCSTVLLQGTGCSLLPEGSDAYKRSKSLPPLAAPVSINLPPVERTYHIPGAQPSTIPSARTNHVTVSPVAAGHKRQFSDMAHLNEPGSIQFMQANQKRWLNVKASPDQLWAALQAFWMEKNITLSEVKPNHGIIKTEWLELADYPGFAALPPPAIAQDRAFQHKERYRVRLERLPESSNVYVTHIGASRKLDPGQSPWQPRQADANHEMAMLTALRKYLSR